MMNDTLKNYLTNVEKTYKITKDHMLLMVINKIKNDEKLNGFEKIVFCNADMYGKKS